MGDSVRLGMFNGHYEQYDDVSSEIASVPVSRTGEGASTSYLKVDVSEGGASRFSNSFDGRNFIAPGSRFQAGAGTWVGANAGLFSLNPILGGAMAKRISTGRQITKPPAACLQRRFTTSLQTILMR
jgi:hypothetical protein